MFAKDSQGRDWWKAVAPAGKDSIDGMKMRGLTAEEAKDIKKLTFEAFSLLDGLAFPDRIIEGAYLATTGTRGTFSPWFAVRRLTTVRSNVRKIAGDDANITIQLTRIVKEMKAITGTAPKGL